MTKICYKFNRLSLNYKFIEYHLISGVSLVFSGCFYECFCYIYTTVLLSDLLIDR